MPNRPNVIGSKILFQAVTETLFTNTIIDAIDAASTSTDIYPHAYTASLGTNSSHVWRSLAADVDLAALNRVAFGLFLGDEGSSKGNVIYNCQGSLKFTAEVASVINAYPIFGRCDASTVTSSTVAAANLLASYIILPMRSNIINTGSSSQVINHFYGVSEDVIVTSSTVADPVFFGWVIENNSATAWNLDQINSFTQFGKYVADIEVYTSTGR